MSVEQNITELRRVAAAGLNQLHIANQDHGKIQNEEVLNDGIRALGDLPESDLQTLLAELRKER